MLYRRPLLARSDQYGTSYSCRTGALCWPTATNTGPVTVALQAPSVGDTNLVKGHAPWRNPTLKSQINFAAVAPIDGAESDISAWVALACEKALGQELSAQEEHLNAELVASAKAKELEAWKYFKVFTPVCSSSLPKSSVDTRWVLT